MRLQKNTLLALYSVIEFASDADRHISAAEIADKHGVSAHHLAKVLAELARAGVVESVRGVGGGYRFAGNTRRLALMDIIQLFEDFDQHSRAPSPDVLPSPRSGGQNPVGRDTGAHTARAVDRALGAVLSEIDEIAKATFRSITLATMLRLVERQQDDGTVAAAPHDVKPGPLPPATKRPRKHQARVRRKEA
ncbi:MAG: Rrf2 family transcriptional regulator [Betaproteobacteria bacterium]